MGIVAIKLWAGEQKEEIIAIPENPVANATASPTKEWVDTAISFDGSGSKDMDTKITWEETEEGYKYNFQRFPVAGTVEKWEWDFGDGNTGVGKTTTHTYTKPDVSTNGHEVTLKITDKLHGETAEATTSVRIWPKVGEMRITGPAIGKSGQPRTYTAHVWDTYGGGWSGSKYPVLDYRWWECGNATWTSGTKTHTFTWYPSFPFDFYFVKFEALYNSPSGHQFRAESGTKKVTIFWRPTRRRK